MGLGFKEVIDITKKGYTPGDIVELNNIIKEGKHNQDDILSLALNGMKIDDVKKTLLIIEENASQPSGQSSQEEHKPDDNKGAEGQETGGDSSGKDADDNIDYKKKYEEEKALREKLQNENARKGAEGSEGGKDQKKETDYDIALKFAESVLN